MPITKRFRVLSSFAYQPKDASGKPVGEPKFITSAATPEELAEIPEDVKQANVDTKFAEWQDVDASNPPPTSDTE